jgi:hypothetical protein
MSQRDACSEPRGSCSELPTPNRLADLVRGVAITNLAAPQQIAYVFARPTDNAGISVRTGSISIPRVSGSTSPIRW